MINAIPHGGLHGKIKGMFAKRISDFDYAELKNKSSVSDIAAFLKNHPGYSAIFSDIPDRSINRISLENILIKKLHLDFKKLLKYVTDKDKKFLHYFIYQNEIDQILKYIRLIISGNTNEYDYVPVNIFKDSESVDFSKFKEAKNLSEFIEALKGSPYHDLLAPFKDKEEIDYTNIEITLQTYFFKTLFKLIDKYINISDKNDVRKFTQNTIDLLNFTRVMRCVKMGLERQSIYANLIPFSHDISKEKLTEMINANSYNDAFEIIKTTSFKKLFENFEEQNKHIESFYYEFVWNYSKEILKNSLGSVRLVYAYLWLKEIEVKNLINIIEAKSYNLSNEDTEKFLIGTGKER